MNREEVSQPYNQPRPSLEVAVARVEERVANLTTQIVDSRVEARAAHSELSSELKAMTSRLTEAFGLIAELGQYRKENEQHWAEHMSWADAQATDLNQVGEALATIESERHDGRIKASVWKGQAKFVLGGGLGGGTIVAIIVAAWNILGIQVGAIIP